MTTTESLGPADEIIRTLLNYVDHLYHGRPGMVVRDAAQITGVRWEPVTHRVENDAVVVYQITKTGRKSVRTRVGVRGASNQIVEAGRVVGEYRETGFFTEVVTWVYGQIARVWELDNEFAARWASYAFKHDHLDLKMLLAAFLLVQNRKGDPIADGAFYDDDFRDVGEAMLLASPGKNDHALRPKDILRIYRVLTLPGVAEINRRLGFTRSSRKPFLGRWPRVVAKWLRHREENAKLLNGLITKGGYTSTVRKLAEIVNYHPTTPKFLEALRWKQKQAADGRRTLFLGQALQAAENWSLLSEEEICRKVMSDRPDIKRLVGLVPSMTRAIMAAAVEAGCLSHKDLIRYVPTFEELGLLAVPSVRIKVDAAAQKATDLRAINIAKNVRTHAAKAVLQQATDAGLKNAVVEVMKDLRVYIFIDKSGSMTESIDEAKSYIKLFIQAFPLAQMHIAVFDQIGREVSLKANAAAAVDVAFRGISAGGGTNHTAGIHALQHHQPRDNEDVIFIFVGDEGQPGTFTEAVRASRLRPTAFGLILMASADNRHQCITNTARALGVPCFRIDRKTFGDVYAIPRLLRDLIKQTPVNRVVSTAAPKRLSLIEEILKADLLVKPQWA